MNSQQTARIVLALLFFSIYSFNLNANSMNYNNIQVQDNDSVFAVVDKDPEFPGGEVARNEFIKQHVQYPEEAQTKHQEGRVIVQFVINSLGEIKNAKVVKSVYPSLDKEALRVTNSFPMWIPGEIKGKKVSVYHVMPISFKYTPVENDSANWDINDKTVIVIDSLIMPSNFNLNVISPEKVITTTILKPFPVNLKNKLIAQYGPQAEDGVILIKTQKNRRFIFTDSDACSPGDEKYVYKEADKMPEFPGGEKELLAFISRNLHYPIIAAENGVQGKVTVKFIVDKSGKVQDARVVQSLEPTLDDEALRVVNLLPNWTPGEKAGQKINMFCEVPITYRLEGVENLSNSKKGWERNNKTIVLLDGAKMPAGFNLNLLKYGNLASYNTYKPTSKKITEKLIAQYGEDAVNGVIVIRSIKQKANETTIQEISPANIFIDTYLGSNASKNGPIRNGKTIKITNVNTADTDNVRKKDSSGNKIYDVIEQMPEFPGGDTAFLNYINKNLQYPINARNNHIQGRVITRFVVNSSGKVEQAEILKSIDPECDKEALRVLYSLPDFIPGKQNGKNVSVWYTMPITFRL